jgi:hypothetical protein
MGAGCGRGKIIVQQMHKRLASEIGIWFLMHVDVERISSPR